MNFSFLRLNKKIALVSLGFLASLASPQQSFAGDGKAKGENPFKKRKTAHATQQTTAEKGKEEGESLIKTRKPTRTITLEYVDDLITKAKKGDEKAQDELVGLWYIKNSIAPEKIDFLNWRTPNSEETIANRCYINDEYAFFVLKHFAQEEIKEYFPKLFDSIQDRAAQKHAGAQYNLGNMFYWGNGVQKDEKAAASLYKLAADQGNLFAQSSLGIMYGEGRGGLRKDEKEAVHLFTLAATQGYPAAQFNLAIMYAEGRGGLQKDEKEAAHLFTLAAAQRNPDAQNNLAIMYAEGRGGLQKDEKEAAHLFTLAAAQGHSSAQISLAVRYEQGRGGLKKDEGEAIRLYQLAADQGDPRAQINLGLNYEQGRSGLQKDALMAIGLYHKSKLQLALKNLSSYLTFTTIENETKESEVSEVDSLDNFHANTKVLVEDMQEKSLFHIQDSSIVKLSENNFSMNSLYDHYNTIADAGRDLDYWAATIKENRHPGFLINCIQPTQKLLDGYKEDTEGEKAGFCRVDVDGQFYYCIGASNPKLGYDLRAFLRKKENFLSELKELNDKLVIVKQVFDYVTKISPSFKPQLEQIEGELALVPGTRKAIEKGFSDLANIIKQNVGVRNKAFRDANEEYFK